MQLQVKVDTQVIIDMQTICEPLELMDARSDKVICTDCVQDGLYGNCLSYSIYLCNANYFPATTLFVIDMRTPIISCYGS